MIMNGTKKRPPSASPIGWIEGRYREFEKGYQLAVEKL
jgi:hypothetical protein